MPVINPRIFTVERLQFTTTVYMSYIPVILSGNYELLHTCSDGGVMGGGLIVDLFDPSTHVERDVSFHVGLKKGTEYVVAKDSLDNALILKKVENNQAAVFQVKGSTDAPEIRWDNSPANGH